MDAPNAHALDTPPDAPVGPPRLSTSIAELVARARAMLVAGERRILGITGTPGAGKSTLCAALAAALGREVAVVGMDGFHLANQELVRLGRRDRKGAPDTFDADGYATLLERLRTQPQHTIYAPTFNRDLEESIGSAVPVAAGTPLIVTEGNYLLLNDGAWSRVRPTLDAVWFLAPPEDLRLARLIARHEAHGRSGAEAAEWVGRVDQGNARLIEAGRDRADLIIQLTD
ncbi:nucleoside/nucleotide kinase family protein [Deinococcus alpinitundrae]|uniref:nucleoside/nucleotide kinase family protein n=1 Tax=Deinococcus alpinitundrae TaxID=468913 RepID=UPI00137B209D|nr:nucleoside/nucleotide kinase family protein [Deinococcus alpinitundrae]